MPTHKPAVDLQDTFDEIAALLEHHRALMALANRQDTTQRGVAEQLQQRQNAVDLRRRVSGLHPADLAACSNGLASEDRLRSGPRSTRGRRRKSWWSSMHQRARG